MLPLPLGIAQRRTTSLRMLWTVVAMVCGVVLAMACTLVAAMGERGLAAQEVGATACDDSWKTVPSAPELRNPLALAPVAPDDVWIVGNKGLDANGTPTTGAEHWDGNDWTLFPTPNGGTGMENALTGADAVSSNNVWAVGYYGGQGVDGTGTFKTLIEHWDGDQWRLVTSPNVGANSNTLADVDALGSDRAWAVGYYREGDLRKTLIQRWNGTSWSVVPSPNPGSRSNALLSVAAISANNVWAVGYRSSGAGYRSLILHYDGTSWTQVGVPTVGNGDNILTSISAVDGGDVWAAGYYVNGTQHKTLTLRYEGAAWNQVPSANGGEGATVLRGIGAFSSNDAWAVGMEYRPASKKGYFVASTQHWDGSSWTDVPSAIAQAGTRSEAYAVAKAAGTSQVWAAGRPSNVETICPSGGTVAAAAQTSDTSTTDVSSAPQVQEQSSPSLNETASVQEVAASGGTPVTAVDKARNAGVYELTRTRGAVVRDFNEDGLLDIFFGRHQLAARLYINDGGGHFTEANTGTFVRTDRHGCDAADVNGDGLEDIFCTVGAAKGTQAKHNELYVQRQDHTFVDRAHLYGLLEPFARGRFGTFINANGDTHPDLFAANYPDRADGLPSPNRLFVSEGGSGYRYAPDFGLELELGGGNPSGGNASVGDLDKDGWQDLVMDTGSGLRVYHNNQGKGFTDVAASVGLGQNPEDAILSDVNGDGWLDVIEVSRNSLSVMRNTNGTFSSAFSTTLQYGLSVAAGDVNGDDRPDVYVLRGKNSTGANAPDLVYLNNGTGTNFAQMSSIPSTSEGRAESATPIDYDGNGLTDFLVQNGGSSSSGPVQLIAFFPASP